MKKQRITPTPIIKVKTDDIPMGDLPEAETVNEAVALLTHKTNDTPPPSVTADIPSTIQPSSPENPTSEEVTDAKKTGRPAKANAIGRTKYTTALSPDLIKWLRVEAATREITPADLLEEILTNHIKS